MFFLRVTGKFRGHPRPVWKFNPGLPFVDGGKLLTGAGKPIEALDLRLEGTRSDQMRYSAPYVDLMVNANEGENVLLLRTAENSVTQFGTFVIVDLHTDVEDPDDRRFNLSGGQIGGLTRDVLRQCSWGLVGPKGAFLALPLPARENKVLHRFTHAGGAFTLIIQSDATLIEARIE